MTFDDFINRVQVATQYKFTDDQLVRIRKESEGVPESKIMSICLSIERSPNHPKNIYGLILGNLDWAKDQMRYEQEKIRRFKTKADCATPDEISLTFEVTALIMGFENSAELLKLFSEKFEIAIKKDMCLEFLQRSKQFYQDKIKEGVKLKNPVNAF
jgi:hypothetical protein